MLRPENILSALGVTQVTIASQDYWDVVLEPNPEQCHVYHPRRSGGHGIVDWLMGHHEPPKIHYNQAQLLGEGRMKVQLDQVSQIRGTNGQPWFTVVSLEDIAPNAIAAYVQPPRRAVLLLRDPFNTLASRLAIVHKPGASEGWPDTNRNFPTLWKQYAREFLNPHFLPHAVRVNFNRWYVNRDYRREIAAQLGWTFNDRGFGSKEGWRFSLGSSFGETDPKNLHLFSRWRHFEGNAEYVACFDDEMRDLSQRIFDFAPPLKRSAPPCRQGAEP